MSTFAWSAWKKKAPLECKCGEVFKSRSQLNEHIALANPHWPRRHPDDQHGYTFNLGGPSGIFEKTA